MIAGAAGIQTVAPETIAPLRTLDQASWETLGRVVCEAATD